MAYLIRIPIINPLHFTLEGYTPAAQYNSKHIADFQHEETIRSWQQFVQWFQPWQRNDTMKFQVHSQLGPIYAHFYDQYDVPVLLDVAFTQRVQSYFDSTLYVYELSQAVSAFAAGYYKMKITFGSPVEVTVYSNWFEVAEAFPDSLLMEFKHYKHYQDAMFETGWSPNVRMYGSLVYNKPGSKNVVYENQESDMTLIDAKPFNTYTLYTGGPEGIPDWAIVKYNCMIGCSTVILDGKYYTKATDGASFSDNSEKDYPMRGWSIELRDKLNRASKLITSSGGSGIQNDLGLTVVINVETKGFVNDDAGGSYKEVSDVE
jgi:hypothetical protein